ncbi:hypothetical protein KKG83_01635 [Candidatus Micrarchaeota archaeon]|nr:hypothetical protein [Candidatus Micrarchaeota archaeon]
MIINEVVLVSALNQKRLSGIIVSLLFQEWPLTVKGIQNKTKNKFSKQVSLQAVYKETKKLEKESIVLKSDKHYKLNLVWLKKIKEFSQNAIIKYKEKETNLVGLP